MLHVDVCQPCTCKLETRNFSWGWKKSSNDDLAIGDVSRTTFRRSNPHIKRHKGRPKT